MNLLLTALVLPITAIIYANLFEWLWHKHVFHGLGKKKKSRFNSHWGLHHRKVRKSGGYDLSYQNKLFTERDPTREAIELFVAASLHLPLVTIAPTFVATLYVHALTYFMLHRQAHLDPEWAKKWLPWHYEHHMGKNQDANWCVTFPLWDHILGTREYYLDAEVTKK